MRIFTLTQAETDAHTGTDPKAHARVIDAAHAHIMDAMAAVGGSWELRTADGVFVDDGNMAAA